MPRPGAWRERSSTPRVFDEPELGEDQPEIHNLVADNVSQNFFRAKVEKDGHPGPSAHLPTRPWLRAATSTSHFPESRKYVTNADHDWDFV